MSRTVQENLWLSVANAAMAFTVAEMKPFRSFREWMKAKSYRLGELFACGDCLGHWTALT